MQPPEIIYRVMYIENGLRRAMSFYSENDADMHAGWARELGCKDVTVARYRLETKR